MNKGRVEAFSDGVLAIIITIMVLELKIPHEPTLAAFAPVVPVLASYVLSFIFIGIYWNNHHHMFHVVKHVNGAVLWANLHLLFWLSLIPFATEWLGENQIDGMPSAIYGFILLMCAIAFTILAQVLIRLEGRDSVLAQAIGLDRKGLTSIILYAASIPLAFLNAWLSVACFIAVALMWLVPDPRVERLLIPAKGSPRDQPRSEEQDGADEASPPQTGGSISMP